MTAATLVLQDVVVDYHRKRLADVRAVAGATLLVERGQVDGLVGESGCGKSTLARAATGLVPITSGSVEFDGRAGDDRSRVGHVRAICGRLQMVFQDPNSSLNPRRSVGDQLEFALERGRRPAPAPAGLARRSCWTRSACPATRHVACPPSSAAASGSGSASPGRSPPTRR